MSDQTARTCKICGTEKNIDDFYKNRAVCKSCYILKQTVSKEKLSVITPSMGKLLNKLIAAYKTAHDEDDLRNIFEILKELTVEVTGEINKDVYLGLVWNLSDPVRKYYEKCLEKDFTQMEILRNIHNESAKNVFHKVFGINQGDLTGSVDEINSLFDIRHALEMAYNHFIDDYNNMIFKVDPHASTVQNVKFNYDKSTRSFVVSHNPLRLTPKEFLEKIDKETRDHWGFVNHHNNGLFDGLYKMYGVTQTSTGSLLSFRW